MFMLNLMQISNQCALVVTIKVPEIIVDTKKMGFLSTGRLETIIFRVCMGLIAGRRRRGREDEMAGWHH